MGLPAQTHFHVAERGHQFPSALLMGASLVLVDFVALSLAVLAGFSCWSLFNPSIPPLRPVMLLAASLAVASFAYHGMYPGIGMPAVEIVRRIARKVTLVYLLLVASMFLTKQWWAGSRGGFVLSWLFSLALVPLARWISAYFLDSRPWWGVPVLILGAGDTAGKVIRNLKRNRVLGYRPVICLDDDPRRLGVCEGVPVEGNLFDVEYFADVYGVRYAMVAMPGMSREKLLAHLQRWSRIFPNILIVPDLFGVASLWTEPRDLGGVLGLEIKQSLLVPFNRWVKRALDLALAGIGLIVSAPLLGIAVLWIKRTSPGRAFYHQERQGQDGKVIRVWKLRTMYQDAERMLRRYLDEDPRVRQEWDRHCKLKNDPRILPGIGRFLRSTSLDELPQLWNILKGEMSLVGPRPFPRYHNDRFHPDFRNLRMQVPPGLTGLWQVSERSEGDLEVQASLDSYYIRNWSVWLDLYILARTVRTVVAREGA